MTIQCPEMTLKSLADIQSPTIKKWAIHRPDGYMLKRTLSDSERQAKLLFLKEKHPNVPFVTIAIPAFTEKLWAYWQREKFSVNQLVMSFDEYHTLVNENEAHHG